MPLPKPTKDDTEESFVKRMMGNPTMVKEYPDAAQREAVAHSLWRNRNNSEEDLWSDVTKGSM